MINSSPSSAESSFRELDEVFLQTQTRIWLGEVLNARFDEELHISDLLQDGEILFEVSKVVWNSLLTKCMELRHLRHKYGPFGSKKSSGRYRPYSNVDSFLKICKILGLSGIDLFSPSDVVEKKNVRKVCICIRALSKKARSKQLSVPDFDMVINSVAMPTDMVGVIRRSLESSQCTLSSSSSYSSRKGSQVKLKQKNLHAPSNRDDDSNSEDSDEAESRYMGEISFSSAGKFDYADGVNSDLENSPESDVKCRYTDELKHGQRKSASLSKTVRSASPQDHMNDHELDQMSSCGIISKKKLNHGVSHVNNEERRNISNINFTLENDDSVVGDSSCVDVGESNYISDYLAFSDLMVHATDGSNPGTLDGENNLFDFFLNVDSQGLSSDKRSFQNGSRRKFSEDEEMEVSSTTSMSSILGRLLNLEFDDQFDEDDSLSTNVYSFDSKEHEAEKHYKDSFALSEPPKMETFETQSDTMPFDSPAAQPETAPSSSTKCDPTSQNEFELSGIESLQGESHDIQISNLGIDLTLEKESETFRTTVLGPDSDLLQFGDNHISVVTSDHLNVSCNNESVEESERSSKQLENINARGFTTQNTPLVVSDVCKSVSNNNPCLPVKDTNGAHVVNSTQDNITSAAENHSQDKRENSLNILAESIPDGRKGANSQLPPVKPDRKPLLKTVVKGTAIAGVLFLLLHIGRKSKGNNAEETKQYAQVSRYSGSKSSSTKQRTGSVGKGIYPTEKIKL
ncbi:UNVERIFIED_CONTAM: protein OPAQUE10 [Sesamum angustifolium]|uniref:Protein OPAQUE10 n=1 Tax=Sesamum angustifolium TaxID=2727405 RepID=A0AAW2NHD1_9LAMI